MCVCYTIVIYHTDAASVERERAIMIKFMFYSDAIQILPIA